MQQFHFDLSHLNDDLELAVEVGGQQLPLRVHTNATLETAARSNALIDRLGTKDHKFTHYADLSTISLANDAVCLVSLVRKPSKEIYLPQILRMTHYIPEGALRAFFRKQFDIYRRPLDEVRALFRHDITALPTSFSAILHNLGIFDLPKNDEQALDLLVSVNTVVDSMTTAGSLVAFHPSLANMQPAIAAIVMGEHILPDPSVDAAQYNAMQVLAGAIEDVGDEWSPIIQCCDKDGNPLRAGYDLDPGNGGLSEGDQLYTQTIDDSVYEVLSAPVARANLTARNNPDLCGKTWAPQTGVTAVTNAAVSPPSQPPVKSASSSSTSYKWTVNEQTSHYGVSVDKTSIRVDDNDNFSIDANNSYLRTLYAGYQLKDERGKPISDIQSLRSISATNTVMGAPVSTDPTPLEFDLDQAAQVELLFGSLGTSDWQVDISDRGAMLTGLWQYGIPMAFIVAGKALKSSSTFNEIVNDEELVKTALTIAIPYVGVGSVVASALTNYRKVLFSLANIALGIAFEKGMEKLGEWMLAQLAASKLKKAMGPVGMMMRVASAVVNTVSLAVTTTECLASPATVRITASRAIDVTLTLHPDPAHGEVGNPATAVWPSVATRYQVTLQYKQGTSFVEKGPMPTTTSNTPLTITFTDVPAGGEFQIIAGVYSETGWLAGSWQSDCISAHPNSGSTLDLGDHEIVENLVPLAPATQYVYKEELTYDGSTFEWNNGEPATATVDALDPGDSGTLCELVGMTINNSAFQVGYTWRSSGQNLPPDTLSAPQSDQQLYGVQSLSVLAEPSSRLIQTDIGFMNRPQIAYAPSITSDEEINQQNFVLDPRGGGMHLRQVELSEDWTDFGFGNSTLQSWGRFPLQNLDALAVHPSNMVVGVSFQDHKMMIAPLPATGVPDDEAPEALIVSGEGIQQGLMKGPMALAISPDGRILVLESANNRVQAFDIKGNPVTTFTPDDPLFALTTADIAADLDAGNVPSAFVNALVDSSTTYQDWLDDTFVTQLDSGQFVPENDPLIQALSEKRIFLSYNPDDMNNPTVSSQIQVVMPGLVWDIIEPRGYAWRLVLQDGLISIFSVPAKVTVKIQTQGQRWLLTDNLLGQSWQFSPSTAEPTQTLVNKALSYFPLTNSEDDVTYLDMGVEAEGHIYVLYYINNGSATTDYYLDIYAPTGTLLLRTPDSSVTASPQNVVAGKIAVDIWRNLYTLGFGSMAGPNGAVQPQIAHWHPTTPLFSLDVSLQKDLNDQNITVVTQAFAENGVTLTNNADIFVDDPEGSWRIKDGQIYYHIYRIGAELQVYNISAA